MRDHRKVVEGIICRYRCGIAWRDLPASFGPWKTVQKLHRRFGGDGTWDAILAALPAQADAAQEIDWTVSVDSTINRAHQHATSRSITASAARVAGCPPRSTTSSTVVTGRWSSWSAPDHPGRPDGRQGLLRASAP